MDFDRRVHICHVNYLILYSSSIYSTEKRYNINKATTSSACVWPCISFCAQCCTREHPACFDHLIHTYTSLRNRYCFLSRAVWLFMKWIIHDMNFNHAWLMHYPRLHSAKHRICSPLYSITMDIHLKVKRFMWLSHWINEIIWHHFLLWSFRKTWEVYTYSTKKVGYS